MTTIIPTSPRRAEALRAEGLPTPDFYELTQTLVAGEIFRDTMLRALRNNDYAASVHVYSAEEYAEMRLYLSTNGGAGFALRGDEIVSGFCDPTSPDKGSARAMVATAVDLGGRRCDAFDTVLPWIYAREGLRVVARLPWDDDHAPEGWDYEVFRIYNDGRPDVTFMAYDEDTVDTEYQPGSGYHARDYDQGLTVARAYTDGYRLVA